jgi:hypothetical protein
MEVLLGEAIGSKDLRTGGVVRDLIILSVWQRYGSMEDITSRKKLLSVCLYVLCRLLLPSTRPFLGRLPGSDVV